MVILLACLVLVIFVSHVGGIFEGLWYRANHFEFAGSVLRREFDNHVQSCGWLPHYAILRPATSPRRVEHH